VQLPLAFESPGLRLTVLGSGSAGNSVVLDSGGRRLMVDAGFSCKELERRLEVVGIDPATLDGLVLTHEHGDHVRGVRRLARRHGVPVFATAGTLEGLRFDRAGIRTTVLRAGHRLRIGRFEIEPFAVPHDAREPIGLVAQDEAGLRVGLVADLGTRCRDAWSRLRDLDALILESNHDLDMLRDGPYPWPLKQRIAGAEGHLSNRDAAAGIVEVLGDRLRWVVLYHLSRTNNRSPLAEDAVRRVLEREDSRAGLVVSSQFEPTPWLSV